MGEQQPSNSSPKITPQSNNQSTFKEPFLNTIQLIKSKKRIIILGLSILIIIVSISFFLFRFYLKIEKSAKNRKTTTPRTTSVTESYSPSSFLKEIGQASLPISKIVYTAFLRTNTGRLPLLSLAKLADVEKEAEEEIFQNLYFRIQEYNQFTFFLKEKRLYIYNKDNLELSSSPLPADLLDEYSNDYFQLKVLPLNSQFYLVGTGSGKGNNYNAFFIYDSVYSSLQHLSKLDCQKSSCIGPKIEQVISSSEFIISFTELVYSGGKIYKVSASTLESKIILKYDDCCVEKYDFIGTFNEGLIFIEKEKHSTYEKYTKNYISLWLLNPKTEEKTSLLDGNTLPKDITDINLSLDKNELVLQRKNSYFVFNLKNRTLSEEKHTNPTLTPQPSSTEELKESNENLEGFKNRYNQYIEIEKNTGLFELNGATKSSDSEITDTKGDVIAFSHPDVISSFNSLASVSGRYKDYIGSYTVDKVWIFSPEELIFEVIRRESNDLRDLRGRDPSFARGEIDQGRRIGLFNLKTGKIYLVDQDRSTYVGKVIKSVNTVVLVSPSYFSGGISEEFRTSQLEALRYRIIDFEENKVINTFVFDYWEFENLNQKYGPNLYEEILKKRKIDYEWGRVATGNKVLVSNTKAVPIDDSFYCDAELCSFNVRLQRSITDTDELSPFKEEKEINVIIDRQNKVIIQEP